MSSLPRPALALDGGRPSRPSLLEFAPPVIGREEIESVTETLRSAWLTSGPRVEELERRFAAYVGARHAVATSSCTTALELALVAAGIGPGDEVVTASFTWPATVNAILHAGATPVMVDVEPDALTLDPEAVRAALSPRTRALLPVHFAGAPCDMDALEEIARPRRLVVIEDAAHAVETTVGGRKVGAIGDFTCFSLYATKSLAGGEGGVVTTASDAAAERLRLLRSHGITRDSWRRRQSGAVGHYDVVYPGYKANLSDLQAAVVLPKLEALDSHHAHRRALADRYDAGIAELSGIEPLERPERGRHAHHLYVVRIDPEAAGADRDRYATALRAENVASGIHFLPVHTLTWYSEQLPPVDLPVSQRAGQEVLSLPLAAAHSSDDIDDAVAALHKVHRALTRD